MPVRIVQSMYLDLQWEHKQLEDNQIWIDLRLLLRIINFHRKLH